MPARIGIEGRNAHQAMHAGFGLQPAIGVLALDQNGRRFDAGLFAFALLDDIRPCSRCVSAQRVYMRSSIAAQSWLRCRPRPHGFRDRRRWRRPRPRAWIRASSLRRASASPASAAFRLGDHRLVVLGFGHFDQADGIVELAFERAVVATAPGRAALRSRISVCASCGIVPEVGGLRLWRSVHRGGGRHCPSQRCLLSRASACLISSMVLSVSLRMARIRFSAADISAVSVHRKQAFERAFQRKRKHAACGADAGMHQPEVGGRDAAADIDHRAIRHRRSGPSPSRPRPAATIRRPARDPAPRRAPDVGVLDQPARGARRGRPPRRGVHRTRLLAGARRRRRGRVHHGPARR